MAKHEPKIPTNNPGIGPYPKVLTDDEIYGKALARFYGAKAIMALHGADNETEKWRVWAVEARAAAAALETLHNKIKW